MNANKIDPKRLGKVAVLMGGSSAEREISLMSGGGVLAALQSQGVDAHAFDPAERELVRAQARGLRARLHRAARPPRRRRHGAGRAGAAAHPYTGSGVMASAIAIDKVMTKRIWQAVGLPTPKYVALPRRAWRASAW